MGPTWPNRFYMAGGTSGGITTNGIWGYGVFDYPIILDLLDEAGITWKVYNYTWDSVPFGNTDNVFVFWEKYAHDNRTRGSMGSFLNDIRKGQLPQVSWIIPSFARQLDEHPPADVSVGMRLQQNFVTALRASPLKDQFAYLLTYDEHGGYFDHVAPPAVRNPDGKVSTEPRFDFRRGGPRVPAVLVSPWIPKGTVDATVYDHASIPATVKGLFQLNDFLTVRDRTSNPLDLSLWSGEMREDTPETLPRHAEIQAEAEAAKAALTVESVSASLDEASEEPLSELQQSLVDLASTFSPEPELQAVAVARPIETEHEGAVEVRAQTQLLFARQGVPLE